MKRCLTKKFGLTPEQYRMKFRDTQKVSTQSWVDFVDTSLKALEGWIIGNKVNTYEGLYNLIMREHILTNCTQERLRQHLVDSKQTNPREVGEAADEWLRTRVVVKSQVGDSKKGGSGPQKPKEGGGKPTTETSSVPQNPKKEESKSHSHSDKQRQGDPGLKKLLDSRACFDCQQTGHFRGDAACPKKVVSTGLSSVAMAEDSSDDEVLLALSWETGPDGKLVIPEGGSRHFHPIQVNGIPTTGLRDTCASHTIVSDRLVTPDMYVPGETRKVRIATGEVTTKPVAIVPLEREGILDWFRVVVSADLLLDCVLGNDLPESEGKNLHRGIQHRVSGQGLQEVGFDWQVRPAEEIFKIKTKALILTLAGGGGRPPKSRRQVTVPRSKDRGGNSDFPAGLAGGLLQTASQPSGKEASTMKPARNRAGGVEAVRRVQLHPSRISLSAQQTVKYM
ncbi:hypothetical protein NDU88_005259 [Pleurodeles waltl]|uniref:Uncharacterized protein n=1 Tax=Pleurodeles waltl TaxID=8319 RepID=A0AAV7TBQ2_PLEWA|nr:hypothetical protein NDU88_005259 [Pleurodeles waltl]